MTFEQQERTNLVYAGLVYMGEDQPAYREYFAKEYGDNHELRNETYDDIHGNRAELYVTPEIFQKDFGGRAKFIS